MEHDIGSHGGRHRYFDTMNQNEANEDLEFAKSIHTENGLSFCSFIYPRNKVAKLDLLKKHGVKVYRGEDWAWHQRLRQKQVQLGRVANLVDKFLPIAPECVMPSYQGDLVNFPGSMLFLGRNKIRRLIPANSMRSKLKKGILGAQEDQKIFTFGFIRQTFGMIPMFSLKSLNNLLH